MKRAILARIVVIFSLLIGSLVSYAQTVVSTGLTGATAATATGVNVFGVSNANAFPIAITQIAAYHVTGNNTRTYSLWYHPSQLTGAPNITSANGWIQIATSPGISAASASTIPVLTNQYFVIPGNTSYRFALVVNSGTAQFSTTGVNSYSSGGVSIQTGSSPISPGYAGTMPTPTLTPRFFAGSITFVTASVNNISAKAIVSPVNGTQYCGNDVTPVRIAIFNNGASSQTNFPITAKYSSASISNTISAMYLNTLAPFANDTVVIGTLNLPAGAYTIRAYTQLGTDTLKMDDTTATVTFNYKAPVPDPVTISDTVCPGAAALILINTVPNTTYKWYSAQTGGTLVSSSSTTMNFSPLTQDTIMYVAAVFNGCESNRIPISAIVSPPPFINLGVDTIFCENIPLILNGGNPGGKYLWSTGDTTQTITVTNVSGQYWVEVDKYCKNSDTINVTVAPKPVVNGFSFIRMNNTYKFYSSSVQNATAYLWIFGDGATSTLDTPWHTYANGINAATLVKLVVSNNCSTDTAVRLIPTEVENISTSDDGIYMYPNPATYEVNIRSGSIRLQKAYLIDIQGKVLTEFPLDGLDTTIRTGSIPTGLYILRVKTEREIYNKQLHIIQ